MTTPVRVQRMRSKGWRLPEGAVNVSRPCDWSNPFRIGDWVSDEASMLIPAIEVTRELAVALFRAYIAQEGYEAQIRAELAGKDLVCWCPLDQPCHADVLLEIANGAAS